MLKSCSYCGRVHDSNYICPRKPKKKFKDSGTYDSEASQLRRAGRWKRMSLAIRERDNNLCQLCLREGLPETNGKPVFTYNDLSVHHIIPIEDNPGLSFCGSNLITLCFYHHNKVEGDLSARAKLAEIAKEQERRSEE